MDVCMFMCACKVGRTPPLGREGGKGVGEKRTGEEEREAHTYRWEWGKSSKVPGEAGAKKTGGVVTSRVVSSLSWALIV